MTKLNKILVVGAGIAGLAVSYWLKRFGFRPTLIEKSPHLRKGGQPIDVRGVAVTLAENMGIYSALYAKRTSIAVTKYVDQQGNILHEEHGEAAGFRQEHEAEVLRGDLIEILMNCISDLPCIYNQSIENLEQNDHNITVKFSDGRSEHYDIVIGSDGIYSGIRKLSFNPDEFTLISLNAFLSTFTIPNYLNLNHTDILCETKHKLVNISSDKDPKTAMASFMFRSKHKLKNPRDEKEQKQFLSDTYTDFGWEAKKLLQFMHPAEDFYFDSISQVRMQSYSKGRVVLLGDAGFCASPLSGQGNNLALVGAYILAGELKLASHDYAQAFQRYNQIMQPFVALNQKFGVWVSEYFLAEDELSPQMAEERAQKIRIMVQEVANGIVLPAYE